MYSKEDFESFTIDLNNVFEDVETSDVNLLYVYSGNLSVSFHISVPGVSLTLPTKAKT